MLSSLGRRTIVVGWWATWPAEEIDGVVVSDRILEPSRTSSRRRAWRPRSSAASARRPPPGRRSTGSRAAASATARWRGSRKRPRAEDFDLLLVYFRTTDIASHYYWRYFATTARRGRRPRARRCASGIYLAYEAVDLSIADIVAAAGKPVNLIVVSDHGFRASRREQVQVAFDLDAALERLGYLVRDEEGGVDVANSRALHLLVRPHPDRTRWCASARPARRDAAASCAPLSSATLARLTWPSGARRSSSRARRRATPAAAPISWPRCRPTPRRCRCLLDGEPLDGVVGDIHRISGSHARRPTAC